MILPSASGTRRRFSNAAGDISDVNQSMAEITGYTKEEIRTNGGAKIIAPEVLEATIKDWTEQVEEKGFFMVETLWVGKDEQRIPVSVLGKPIVIDGEENFEVIATDKRKLSQQVVEVMCYPTCQPADRFQFLCLPKLFFTLPQSSGCC